MRLVRTIFVSDIHLGHKNCKAREFLDFLAHYETPLMYLIGDVIDGWRLRLKWYWPQSHNDVLEELLKRARLGMVIIYIPGNHDDFVRTFRDVQMGSIKIENIAVHKAADGKQYLVLHGDGFDAITHRTAWIFSAPPFCWVVFPDWAWVRWTKRQIARWVSWFSSYEKTLVAEAKGLDGVICGHSHTPKNKLIGKLVYMNTGDWVDHCSAIIEDLDGTLRMVEKGVLR